jgi:hypothetical protein
MIPFFRLPSNPILLLLVLVLLVLGTLDWLLVRSPEVPPEYVGSWISGPTRMDIRADGILQRRKSDGLVSTSIGGRLTKIGPDELTYRVLYIPRHLTIEAPPHLKDDLWVMTVEGQEFWRIP